MTHDPVPTFDGSQLLRNSSYVSKKAIRVIAQRARGRTCTYCARSTMRGVPAIAANPREGSRLLWFWVKVPTATPKSAQLASRAPARDALALQELVRMVHDPQCRACRQSRQIQEKAQDYSGFGLEEAVVANSRADPLGGMWPHLTNSQQGLTEPRSWANQLHRRRPSDVAGSGCEGRDRAPRS